MADDSKPFWIDCATCLDLPPVERLAELAIAGQHVVMRIADGPAPAVREAIERLAPALPDHRVFMSGMMPASITVHSVVSHARIISRRDDILRALEAYRDTCGALVRAYETGELAAEWFALEHGQHCRFEHEVTGQIVEAPMTQSPSLLAADPYFFGLFVLTTTGHERVAELIASTFHDTARILDVLAS